MDKKGKRKLIVIFLIFLALIFLIWSQIPDDKLHLVFCDIGQGDAIIVRQRTTQVLVDGGLPRSKGKLLKCLKSQMPFWDRKVEMVINTHADEDHFGGLEEVVKRYKIGVFLNNGFDNPKSRRYQELKKTLSDKKIYPKIAWVGESFRVSNIYFDVLWPGVERSQAGEKVQASFSSDLNEKSIVFCLRFGDFDALLTGDIPTKVEQILSWRKQLNQVEVLKIAHHGSKTSTSEEILSATQPELAVISVGENSFGHPHQEVLERLDEFNIRFLRTDKEGTIEIISDGSRFWLAD